MEWALIKLGLWSERRPLTARPIGLKKVRFFRDVVRIPNLSLLKENAQASPGWPSVNSHVEDEHECGILVERHCKANNKVLGEKFVPVPLYPP